jgi:hypothetical protein
MIAGSGHGWLVNPFRNPWQQTARRGDNQKGYALSYDANNGSGQERRYRGKFKYAPWLSKWLNKIMFWLN